MRQKIYLLCLSALLAGPGALAQATGRPSAPGKQLTANRIRGDAGFSAGHRFNLAQASRALPHLAGKPQNGQYLCVTAGDRLYAIGDQAGNFPEVGFHVPGEMGGVWQHPVKLLDGYRLAVSEGPGKRKMLDRSDAFTAHSFTTENAYQLANQLTISRVQFVPDSIPVLVVEYNFQNRGPADKKVAFKLYADVDLRPVWLGEASGMQDGPDALYRAVKKTGAIYKDLNNSWFTVVVADRNVRIEKSVKSPFKGRGVTGVMSGALLVPKGRTATVRFYFGGSMKNAQEALANVDLVQSQLAKLFQKKAGRYRELTQTAALDVPDPRLLTAWNWGKYATDWLVRDVPGLGRGLSAGLPDYPWFFSNEQADTFGAITGFVRPQLFYDSWHLLKTLSDKANNGSGRIIHEASTTGTVYDKGRMEESQLHIEAAWNVFKWTGNLDFLRENYAYVQKTLAWLLQHDQDHDLYVEGYGGVEIKGLNDEMLDVAVRTQGLFRVMARMAAVLQDGKARAAYQAKADTLRTRINRDWWIASESRYADFITDKTKALAIIDTALAQRVHPGRNTWALNKLQALRTSVKNNTYPDQGYAVYYNNSGMMPLAEGIADSAKARQALAHAGYFTNKYGVYISGIERPDDITQDEGSVLARKQGEFNYNQAVMPATTTALAVAEARYGSPDTALAYVHKILAGFGYATPGTTYEVSPDYGMFVQAWNVTGLYIPVVQYFFGIEPLAYKKEITLRPNFPRQWPRAGLRNLLIGNNKFSVDYKKSGREITYKIVSLEPGWKINFIGGQPTQIMLNGRQLPAAPSVLVLRQRRNEITFSTR